MTVLRFHFLALAVVLIGACAHAPSGPVADDAPERTREPLVTENPDGTITVQREAKDDEQGLVIKPQVVTPTVPRKEE